MCLTRRELFRFLAYDCGDERFPSTPIMDRGILLKVGRNRGSFGERARMDWEAELINSFETIVHRDFPNPQRFGCPGRDSLAGLAACLGDAQSPLALAHMRQCAPCFDELKQLRRTNKP